MNKEYKIYFDKSICQNVNIAIEKEWLETNGIGGFASSTIIGTNTRRYHGLLVSNIGPDINRLVMLSKLEEKIILPQQDIPLSTNLYPNTIHPDGYIYQQSFELNPFPTFTYKFGEITLQKTSLMIYDENTTIILYKLINSPGSIHLKIRPLIAFRDYHILTKINDEFNPMIVADTNLIKLKPYRDFPPMFLIHNAKECDETYYWYYNFIYPKEKFRGLDYQEDLCSPCELTFEINEDDPAFIIASDSHDTPPDINELISGEIRRRESLTNKNNLIQVLTRSVDSFIIRRIDGYRTVIAGYPWFTDWGRDTMIALPGLTLNTSRYKDAKEILLTFAKYCDKGMLPNNFPDHSSNPEYNTVDASLWFINAVYNYFNATKDVKTLEAHLYSTLIDITENYKNGTRYNIHLDSDNLIYQGEEGVQLTWMDAKVKNWVVTPRKGKNVEINALWYNGLKIMAFLSEILNKDAKIYQTMASKTKKSFNSLFWNANLNCLYDTIDDDFLDDSIRPNQIFAISLPFSMLNKEKQKSVLKIVKEHLLTPYGLRSLSPNDKNYIGKYGGNRKTRDAAYHQGTVWSWLIGPYIEAYLKAYGQNKKIKSELLNVLQPLTKHLIEDAAIGFISEIFDGDKPYSPKGCIAQAWSVAELLRVYQMLTQ